MKTSREKQVAQIEHFAALWDRLVNLYLNEEEFEDISASKEDEFLGLEGAIMQELGTVTDLEEGRFALVEEVTSVVNEAFSLHHLKGQSEFQVRRRKERGQQVADIIAKVKTFVAERDSSVRRQEKEHEKRLSRPFWDPEKGKFRVILGRVVVSPARFFSAVRAAGEAKRANSFLLSLLCTLAIGCVIAVVAFNASVARAISYNFALESGILTSDAGWEATLAVWIFVAIGVVIVSLAGAIAAAILAHLLVVLMHAGFKIVGGKEDMVASHKVVIFGLTPLLLLLLLPVIGYLVRSTGAATLPLWLLGAATFCYIAVLHIVGVKKVHDVSAGASIAGWLIGTLLFVAVGLAALWTWHFAVGGLPPSSGKYVFVTAKEATLSAGTQAIRLSKGEVLGYVDEEEEFYKVTRGKEEGKIRKADGKLRQGSVLSLPVFLVESSVARAQVLIDRLSRRIEKEAR